MQQLKIARLADRSLIKIGASEAQDFLQNIFTCNIDEIKPGGASFGGLLSPQGKILFDFYVVRDGDDYLLDVAADMAEDLLKRLTFYRLRADVDLQAYDDQLKVFAIWGDKAPNLDAAADSTMMIGDPKHSQLGWRVYSPQQPGSFKNAEIHDYHSHRIGLGVPEGGLDYGYGDAFPHEALYDQTGGVDFAKGCYVGQEVVSRMHHRGTARKRVIQVTSSEDLPKPGTRIEALEKPVGELGSVSANKGLAMVRLDRVSRAKEAGNPLVAEGVVLEANIQLWAKIEWPEA